MTAPASFTTTDRTLVDKTLKRWRSGALRVRSAKVETLLTPVGPMRVPLVTVAPRTDVVDLIRRHQPELDGEGDVTHQWRFMLDTFHPRESRAIVRSEFTNPARCVFSLEFAILDMLPFLRRTCELGYVVLSTGQQRGVTMQGIAIPELHEVVFTAGLIAAMEVYS